MAVDTVARALALSKQGGGSSGSTSIEVIQVNGIAQPIVDGVVNVKTPTKTSEITNDSGFLTLQQLQTILEGYVPLSTYNALVDRVAALESVLGQPDTAILTVKTTGGTIE